MIIQLVIVIISFLLDGILSNFLPYMIDDLSILTPFFTIVSLVVLFPYFYKREKNYYILVFAIGFLYDLFYTNLLFTNSLLFLLVSFIISFIYKKIDLNFMTNIFLIIFAITFYQVIFSLILFIFNVVPITFDKVLYLVAHSLVINVFYGETLYFICKYLPFRRQLN